jgi:CubicO group peptidase (beta-lactamase class C family)
MNRAHAVLREASGTAFTAAVARVEHRGRLIFEHAYGTTRADGMAKPVYVDTPFDLASIGKVFVATCALTAVQRGAIALDEPLVRWFSQWRGRSHEAITLRMLLAHSSGMHSGADYRQLFDKNVASYTIERELADAPGRRVIYSDLGFIALGELLERLHEQSLAVLIARSFGGRTWYRPRRAMREAIPATEEDAWRGRVQGVVHDEKAYLMGGVAGHAGLFGTAQDVAWLCEQYLGPLHGRNSAVLDADLAREAVCEQAADPILRRGLGWALKTTNENSCGRGFSADSFGHTGFVGTCVWSDPQHDCSGVLLTNSVYFGRSDIRDLRAAFYEALIEDLP